MLKLYKISYIQNYQADCPTVKYIKAKTRMDAITTGIPYSANGIEQRIDSIKIEVLCEVDEILNYTSAGKLN